MPSSMGTVLTIRCVLLLFLSASVGSMVMTILYCSQYLGINNEKMAGDLPSEVQTKTKHDATTATTASSNNVTTNAAAVTAGSSLSFNNATTMNSLGRLRRDWSDNPPLSYYGKLILEKQSNCSMPQADFYLDNLYGIGSHLSLWSQAVCNAWELEARLRTINPTWLWLDQQECNLEQASQKSPLLCYLPKSEVLCENNDSILQHEPFNVSDPRDNRQRCDLLKNNETVLKEFRAASTEYLFRSVGQVVIREARRQAGLLFPNGIAPDDLITVHIRWGDKFWEMDLAAIDEYLVAISTILHERQGHNRTANIYLATEDPKALEEFMAKIPNTWTIYQDVTVRELNEFRPAKGNRASHTSKNTRGRAGLVAFGSLLVAMEARDFVLTTKSNWSRLMEQLRTNIIEARFPSTTSMIDLRPGIW